MPKLGRSTGGIKHSQFTSPSGKQTLAAAGVKAGIYGFLIEEPQDDPLYVLFFDKTDDSIAFSMAAEGGKFGRDAQPFPLKDFPNGVDVALSTSRSSLSAATAGATLHVWYSTMGRTSS